MKKEQEEHLKDIKTSFNYLVDKKYRKGAEEHKEENNGLYNCTSEQLINFALDEAIDQVVYLMTLRDKIVSSK